MNQHFLKEAGDYLESNGYTKKEGVVNKDAIYFFNGQKGAIVYNDNIDFMIWQDGEPDQQQPGYSRYMAVTGIGDLDLFKWILLFHITDIVPLKKALQRVPKEDVRAFANEILAGVKPKYPVAI